MPGTDITYERTVVCPNPDPHDAHGYRPPWHDDEFADPNVWYWCPGVRNLNDTAQHQQKLRAANETLKGREQKTEYQHCGRREPHPSHTRIPKGTEPYATCPGTEDLTQHPAPSVAWQARMEQHLADVHALTSEALKINLNHGDPHSAALRAELAKANANAALAYAIALGTGDLELVLSRMADFLRDLEQ